MDLEVVGRHALLFDDDAMAAFVNSGDVLVEWHSLQIDRYDVRHLLSSPPPPRRRNRSSEAISSDDPSIESQLDRERYLDLPLNSNEPEMKDDEKPAEDGAYRAVGFSYGKTDDSTGQKDFAAGEESSGFVPPFSVPANLLENLPSSEKVHQIIARTAIFVKKHGGQSEIILRVKQGDNPTFGFLMPDHHLHAYFRFLVEHPELPSTESGAKKFQEKVNQDGDDYSNSNRVAGALSLLGSVYGSGEEEDDDDAAAKPDKDILQDNVNAINHDIRPVPKKIEPKADSSKDESATKNPIFNKEKVLAVKKNSSMGASKSGSLKDTRIEDKSVVAETAKTLDSGVKVILEPPTELKRVIDKLVEFILRNGKQFETTLIEQDREHGRFRFLLPSNKYHSYYLKVLQTAQESKVNSKSIKSGKDAGGHGTDKRTSVLSENDFSSSAASLGDLPFDSDRKEKFKMVIGKSKKETQEVDPKRSQEECGIFVDAEAAAAILQAATRGIKSLTMRMKSSSPPSARDHVNGRGKPASSDNLPATLIDNTIDKSNQNGSGNVSGFAPKAIARAAALEAAGEADSSEAQLSEEQKRKAERLKRAKMFVAMLKSGAVPFKSGTSHGSSVEPVESGLSRPADGVDGNGKEEESTAPAGSGERPEKNYFGVGQHERLSKRKYRSRSCEEDDEHADGAKKQNGHHSRRTYRSRSMRSDEDDENENAVELGPKHKKRRHRSNASAVDNEDKGESSEDHGHKHLKEEDSESGEKYEEDMDHERERRRKHRSRHSDHDHKHYKEEDSESEETSEEDMDHERERRRKHRSHHSSHENSRKRRSSKRRSDEEDDDTEGRDRKSSMRKRRSHRSSHHSRDKHRHRHRHKNGHSSKDNESRRHHKKESSSDNEHQNGSRSSKHKNNDGIDERPNLEEGEISARLSVEPRGIASGHVSRETSVDLSSHQRAPSRPSENAVEVPNDLRAKIRAMLMETRL